MSFFDPNYISAEFYSASQGYARVLSGDLPKFLAGLPKAVSVREKAIADAVRFGVLHPEIWENRRTAPRVIRREE